MTATLVTCASSHSQLSFVLGILVPLKKTLREIMKTISYFDSVLGLVHMGPLFVFRVALSFFSVICLRNFIHFLSSS